MRWGKKYRSATLLPEDRSPLLEGHVAPSDGQQAQQRGRSLAERLQPFLESSRLVLCTLGLLLSSVGNTLMFKKMTSAMPNYGWYLTQLSSFMYVPVFAFLVSSSRQPLRPDKRLVNKFAVMGLFDGLSGTLMVLGGVHTTGTLQVLLQQGIIPITMVFTSAVAGKRYHHLQTAGAAVIVLGIIMSQIWDSGRDRGSMEDADILVFNTIFFVAGVPSALSNVFKEVAFSDYDGDLDVNVLQLWVAVFQVFTNFFAMPIYSLRLLGPQQVPLPEMLGLCQGGTRCLFFLEDQIVDECGLLGERPCDHCQGAWMAVAGYLAFNLLFNIFTMMVIKHGSAALYSLVATLRMPLSSVAFSSTLIMGSQAVAPSLSTYLSLAIILLGLGAYRVGGQLQERARRAKEEEAFPMPSPSASSAWASPGVSDGASPSKGPRRRFRFMPVFTTSMPGVGLQPAHVLVRAEKPRPRSADRVRRDLYGRLGAASPLHSPQMRHMSPAPDRFASPRAAASPRAGGGDPAPPLAGASSREDGGGDITMVVH